MLLLISTPISAHSGGTDGSGGHYDSGTGEYHYHHGYSAHDHYDMDGDGDLDCPYDFKAATKESSSSSSKAKSSTSSYITSANSKEQSSTMIEYKYIPTTPNWVPWTVALCVLSVVIAVLYIRHLKHESELTQHQYEAGKRRNKEKTKEILTIYNSNLHRLFGDDYLYKLCGTPANEYIGKDNVPIIKDGSKHKWGRKYTFYCHGDLYSRSIRYHDADCRYAASGSPINAFSLQTHMWTPVPCKICNPRLPNMEWASQYIELQKYLNDLDIQVPDVRGATRKHSSNQPPKDEYVRINWRD